MYPSLCDCCIRFCVIVVDRVKEYQEEDPSSSRTFGYYDLGTSMHYNKFVSVI